MWKKRDRIIHRSRHHHPEGAVCFRARSRAASPPSAARKSGAPRSGRGRGTPCTRVRRRTILWTARLTAQKHSAASHTKLLCECQEKKERRKKVLKPSLFELSHSLRCCSPSSPKFAQDSHALYGLLQSQSFPTSGDGSVMVSFFWTKPVRSPKRECPGILVSIFEFERHLSFSLTRASS